MSEQGTPTDIEPALPGYPQGTVQNLVSAHNFKKERNLLFNIHHNAIVPHISPTPSKHNPQKK